jgi:hypothetical protein
MSLTADPTKFIRELLSMDEASATWYIRMQTGHEYRTRVELPPANTGMAGIYTGDDDDPLEYIRIDQIEALRRLDA